MNDEGCQELLSALNSAIKKGAHMMPSVEPQKRIALATIDPNQTLLKHHFLSKDSIWSSEEPAIVNSQQPVAQPLAFEIFQDSAVEIFPPPPKEKRVPLYLRKLYKDQVEEDSKENEYWDDTDVDMVAENKKEDEARWAAPFWCSIHSHLKEIETRLPFAPEEIRSQIEVTESMRAVLMDWLIEVGEEYGVSEEAVHLAVTHVDRCLQKKAVARFEVQLLGTTALFIASKQCDVYPPELKDFVYVTNETYTKRDVLKMELCILKTLEFFMHFPTANSFLEMYTHLVESTMNSMTIHLSHYICDAALLSLDVLEFPPSQTGAACLAIARKLMLVLEDQEGEVWPQLLSDKSGYLINDLRKVAEVIYGVFVMVTQTKTESALYKKYLKKKYEEVARIRVPRYLEL